MKESYLLLAIVASFGLKANAIREVPGVTLLSYPNEPPSLRQVYRSAHLSVHVHVKTSLNESLKANFPVVSNAWLYLKDTYGPISDGPRIFLLIDDSDSGCLKISQYRDELKLPKIDKCDDSNLYPHTFATFQPLTLPSIILALGKLVRLNAKRTKSLQDFKLCGDQLNLLVAYDITSHLYGTAGNLTLQTLENFVGNQANSNGCFKTFFLPIFKTFGPTPLHEYFSYTSKYWDNKAEREFMNLGEFVHFWSGSAGQTVQGWAASAFNWTRPNDRELNKARNDYPHFLYWVNETNDIKTYVIPSHWQGTGFSGSRLYYGDETRERMTFYVDNLDFLNGQVRVFLPGLWGDLCSNFSYCSGTKLNVVANTTNITIPYCTSSNTASIVDPKFSQDHVIICHGKPKDSLDELAMYTYETAKMVLKLRHGIGNWPAVEVSGWSMALLLLYDFTLPLFNNKVDLSSSGPFHRLILHYSSLAASSPSVLKKDAIWFYDWYVPIHTSHGKVNVTQAFMTLLSYHWPKNGSNYARQMNFGEFVHFWSAAAKYNLRNRAQKISRWTNDDQNLFVAARQAFPQLPQYQCLYCDDPGHNNLKGAAGLDSSTVAWVVGASLFTVFLIALAFGTKFYMYRKRIQLLSNQVRDLTTAEVEEFINGNQKIQPLDAHACINSRAFDNSYEIHKSRLTVDTDTILGQGEFGVVNRGVLAIQDDKTGTFSTLIVAVKTVKPDVEVSYFKALLSEIKIMAFIGLQENIVSLLGTVTANIRNREVLLALEFCSKGDLLQHLRKFENNCINLWESTIEPSSRNLQVTYVNTEPEPGLEILSSCDTEALEKISTLNLLEWSHQISNGMSYLTSKKVIHGDLAARNVLLTENNVAKISDFGLSRQLINYSNYLKTSKTPVPWRWLALEALTTQTFSIHSDIWSFGVTLWEIFTLGKVPYSGRTWDHGFVDELVAGLRLPTPALGNEQVFTLIMNCMEKEPLDRIPFSSIKTQISYIQNNVRALQQAPTPGCSNYMTLAMNKNV